jgi:DNA-binding beta-propeller fold protein YncE
MLRKDVQIGLKSSHLLLIIFLSIILSAGFTEKVLAESPQIAGIQLNESPCDVVADPLHGRIYATDTDHLYSIDAATNEIVAKTSIQKGSCGIAVNSANELQYVINGEGHSLQIVNGSINQVIQTIPMDNNNNPLDIAVNSKTDKVYVNYGSPNGGGISVIDGSSNKIVGNIGTTNAYGMAINENTNRLYAINWNYPINSSVSVIDGTSNKVIDTVKGIGGRSHAIAVNPKTNVLYIDNFDEANGASNYISVMSGSTNEIISNITLFEGWPALSTGSNITSPIHLAVDSRNNIIYATNYWSKTLYVIDGESNKVMNSIKMNNTILDVAVNEATGKVYLTDVPGKLISVIDGTAAIPEFPLNMLLPVTVGVSAAILLGRSRK